MQNPWLITSRKRAYDTKSPLPYNDINLTDFSCALEGSRKNRVD